MAFHKKKKTKTEVIEYNLTLAKVVKLTYLESLALEGSLISAGEFETDGEDEFQKLEDESQYSQNEADRISRRIKQSGTDPAGIISGIVSAFGKKTKQSRQLEARQNGYQVARVWNQPQFDIIRYAIGIKDVTVAQFTYAKNSEIVSVPFRSPKEITKVVCRASQFIPSIFPPGNYIEYYIKANQEGSNWIRINPLDFATVFDDSGRIIPRVINFNTEAPLQSRLEESFVITEKPVTEVLFKAILGRPESLENTTVSADGYSPILKSYRLLMTPRDGL